MKKIVLFSIPPICAAAIWGFLTFCAWDINPSDWHPMSRFFFGIFIIAAFIAGVLISNNIKKDWQ